MGGTAGQTEEPGNKVPDDGGAESGKDQEVVDNIWINDAGADGLGYGDADKENCGKIKEGRPDNGIFGREHPCGNHGGDGVGGVVKTVDEIENQGDYDKKNDKDK